MEPDRLCAIAVLIGTISFAMPLCVHAQDNSVEKGMHETYEAVDADAGDLDVTNNIMNMLAIDAITKSATIHVYTEHGVVNLTGDVPNRSVMKEAEKIARNTEHVKRVRNNLKLDRASNASFEM